MQLPQGQQKSRRNPAKKRRRVTRATLVAKSLIP
jgi:hypothetical protein